ncbi:MAG: pinensin family lanthipeptide [Bacteroidetes bacterium]|nr:pinensin family lanthipeptide [Bacteroidota bacterium]
MKSTKKLSLNEIKVESFVTNLSSNEKITIGGGTGMAQGVEAGVNGVETAVWKCPASDHCTGQGFTVDGLICYTGYNCNLTDGLQCGLASHFGNCDISNTGTGNNTGGTATNINSPCVNRLNNTL